jgi:hypothetical protein
MKGEQPHLPGADDQLPDVAEAADVFADSTEVVAAHTEPEKQGDAQTSSPPQWLGRIRSNLFVRLAAVLVAVLSAVTVIASSGYYGYRHLIWPLSWRDRTYAMLRSLHAGFDLAEFQAKLGAPEFVRTNKGFREETFQGRGFWVQTISDSSGTVDVYAIAACDTSFQPTFRLAGQNTTVTLNRSTLADVPVFGDPDPDYYLGSATGNDDYVDDLDYLGDPGNYQWVVVGVDAACHDDFDSDIGTWIKAGLYPAPRTTSNGKTFGPVPLGATRTPFSREQLTWLKRFNRITVTDLYAETAPLFGVINRRTDSMPHDLNGAFPVGPDRQIIRVAQPYRP